MVVGGGGWQLYDDAWVVSSSRLEGTLSLSGQRVTIGDPSTATTLKLHAPIAGSFPLSFAGGGGAAEGGGGGGGEGRGRVSLGVSQPASDRLLVLPDASGTLLTSVSPSPSPLPPHPFR